MDLAHPISAAIFDWERPHQENGFFLLAALSALAQDWAGLSRTGQDGAGWGRTGRKAFLLAEWAGFGRQV